MSPFDGFVVKQWAGSEFHQKLVESQSAINNALGAQQAGVADQYERAEGLGAMGGLKSAAGLTRLDISSGQRVPVTHEWIDEAVAEIVRLNIEIEQKRTASLASDHEHTEASNRIWRALVSVV